MLPCGGMDEWVHVNCALWSAEVYEDTNGYLCSVHAAIGRGLRLVRIVMNRDMLYREGNICTCTCSLRL